MYCKYCGTEIENGSKFCKQCGVDLNDTRETNQKQTIKKNRFKSISKIGQSAILLYILWLLIIASYVLANSEESHFKDEILYPSLNLVIILPFAIFCVYYIFKIYSKRESSTASNKPRLNAVKSADNSLGLYGGSTLVKVYMLTDFARKKGRMQVIKTSIDTELPQAYCQFRYYDEITLVEFSENIGCLSSAQITENKNHLCIREYKNGRFELDHLDNLKENDVMMLYS